VHVLVPLKRLDLAKSRLAEALAPSARGSLMRALAANALAQTAAAGGVERVTLVSSEPSARELAREAGAEWFDDRDLPWNAALTAAMREVVTADLVGIVSADLPLLGSADVEALAAATPERGAAIARATDAGTNAVFMRPPAAFETCFGLPGSSARHAESARAAGLEPVLVDRAGTAVDLDSAEDVQRFLALAPPGPLRDLVVSLFDRRRIAV
jgi:2-phospho-L-lactate guanylyltransferase